MNLAWAVRISGDGGQERRHLETKGTGRQVLAASLLRGAPDVVDTAHSKVPVAKTHHARSEAKPRHVHPTGVFYSEPHTMQARRRMV